MNGIVMWTFECSYPAIVLNADGLESITSVSFKQDVFYQTSARLPPEVSRVVEQGVANLELHTEKSSVVSDILHMKGFYTKLERPRGIVYFENGSDVSESSISCVALLTENQFHFVRKCVELMLHSPRALTLVVNVDFIGLRSESAHSNAPSPIEFLNGQPIFLKEMIFSFRELR